MCLWGFEDMPNYSLLFRSCKGRLLESSASCKTDPTYGLGIYIYFSVVEWSNSTGIFVVLSNPFRLREF